MVNERAAGHAGRQDLLVERVAAHYPGATGGKCALAGVGARQRDQLVATLDQSRGQRAAYQTAAAGQEDARQGLRSSRATSGSARIR